MTRKPWVMGVAGVASSVVIAASAEAAVTCSPTIHEYNVVTGTLIDGDYCAFATMPVFDQTNPNLAYMTVPDAVYCAEAYPVLWETGYFPEGHVCSNGKAKAASPPVEIYYKSWLPYGPLPGDDGSLYTPSNDYILSATCFPAAEAMALNAALTYAELSTQPKSACSTATTWDPSTCWVETQFITPQAPSGQAWTQAYDQYYANDTGFDAATQRSDPNAGNRDPARMSTTQLQQLVNLAIAENTDPSSGTDGPCFDGTLCTPAANADFWLTLGNNFTTAAGDSVQESETVEVTPENVKAMFSSGYASIIGLDEYKVKVSISHTPGCDEDVLFTWLGGVHGLAVQGYSAVTSEPRGVEDAVTI